MDFGVFLSSLGQGQYAWLHFQPELNGDISPRQCVTCNFLSFGLSWNSFLLYKNYNMMITYSKKAVFSFSRSRNHYVLRWNKFKLWTRRSYTILFVCGWVTVTKWFIVGGVFPWKAFLLLNFFIIIHMHCVFIDVVFLSYVLYMSLWLGWSGKPHPTYWR